MDAEKDLSKKCPYSGNMCYELFSCAICSVFKNSYMGRSYWIRITGGKK